MEVGIAEQSNSTKWLRTKRIYPTKVKEIYTYHSTSDTEKTGAFIFYYNCFKVFLVRIVLYNSDLIILRKFNNKW